MVSLRAERSNLQVAIGVTGGDCFVATLLAMTLGLESNIVQLLSLSLRGGAFPPKQSPSSYVEIALRLRSGHASPAARNDREVSE